VVNELHEDEADDYWDEALHTRFVQRVSTARSGSCTRTDVCRPMRTGTTRHLLTRPH
jgi:hypothetical protein